MKKLILIAIVLFVTFSSLAQRKEQVLTDTISFVTTGIKKLECLNYGQDIYRLNFDDCNLEYVRSFNDDPDKWLIYDIWLADLDEEKMSLDFAEGGWRMTLVSPNKKIEYDASDGSGWVSEMHIYSKDQAPLIEIGRALYFATKACKGQSRFKNR